ncbi:MAG: flagellar export chaperone FliS [Cellvibrionaceae bacterium]
MNAQIALKQYGEVKVKAAVANASPHDLIKMLYDGLLERISQMKGAIQQNNIELKNKKVNQAISIVSGLRESLDLDSGIELSYRLDNIYDYVQRQLWQAHTKNDTVILDECVKLIVEISTAWTEIAQQD